MSEHAALAAYRLATRLGEPAAPALLDWRLRRGKEDAARMGERLGRAGAPRPPGPLAWLHGASVGEGIALLPLVEQFVARGLRVLLTTGTVTSARVLAERRPVGAIHQFVPLDLPGAAQRFFDHWRPDFICFAESELWPNLLLEARRRAIPTVLVNARMSARTFARWRRAPAAIAQLLGDFASILAQSAGDGERYRQLGAVRVTVTGNLKFDVPPPVANPAELLALRSAIGARPAWVAASIHPGEDAVCCAVHRKLSARYPHLLTILVPRKADGGRAMAATAREQGLVARLRSRAEAVDASAAVYVADTMGEIGLFYRAAPVAFVGKSLAGGGGQNPIEPAKVGAAILHGPAVANFDEIYRAFDADGGSLAVADAAALERALGRLFDEPETLADMAARAAETVASHGGATARTFAAMEPLLATVLSGRTA